MLTDILFVSFFVFLEYVSYNAQILAKYFLCTLKELSSIASSVAFAFLGRPAAVMCVWCLSLLELQTFLCFLF